MNVDEVKYKIGTVFFLDEDLNRFEKVTVVKIPVSYWLRALDKLDQLFEQSVLNNVSSKNLGNRDISALLDPLLTYKSTEYDRFLWRDLRNKYKQFLFQHQPKYGYLLFNDLEELYEEYKSKNDQARS